MWPTPTSEKSVRPTYPVCAECYSEHPTAEADLRQRLSAEGRNDEEIRRAIQETITSPCTRFMLAIASRSVRREDIETDPPYLIPAFDAIQPVLNAYDNQSNSKKEASITMPRPCHKTTSGHFTSYAILFQGLDIPLFNCFPIRRSLSPCYMMIDTKILCEQFLGHKVPPKKQVHPRVHWGQVVDLDNAVFRTQEGDALQSRWTMYTDRVGATTLKSETDVHHGPEQRPTPVVEDTVYYGALTNQQREAITGPLFAIDPGRRDLLFCVGAGSTPQNPLKFRYTKAQQDKTRKAKKYQRIIRDLKRARPEIEATELRLSETPTTSLLPNEYNELLRVSAETREILSAFYADTTTNHEPARPLIRKLRRSAYINRQRADQKLVDDLNENFPLTVF